MNKEFKILLYLIAGFVMFYFLPVDSIRFQDAVLEALKLAKWYAREHVLLCLVPAFFIAGAIGVFISQNAVMKYFGPNANKWLAYSVASVSGTILAVCSCTVLPLFGSIYMRGAGLGPAIAFLYSGPAINVLAIVLTARVLGWQLGLARAIGAVAFSVIVGLLMHLIFLKEERQKAVQAAGVYMADEDKKDKPLWQIVVYFFSMVAILVFANWGKPLEETGVWFLIYKTKWILTTLAAILLAFSLWRFFRVSATKIIFAAIPVVILALLFRDMPLITFTAGSIALSVLISFASDELKEWREQTWGFAKQILPLLFGGVLAAGFFLGSPEGKDAGIIPNKWIQTLVGDSPEVLMSLMGFNSTQAIPEWIKIVWPIWTNFFAAITGALMYFATLTEVPILRGLLDSGMGQGPALALLLAGPALSLPSMLVINSILGPKKALTFIALVVVMAALCGIGFGALMR